jgi:hypothetical protein
MRQHWVLVAVALAAPLVAEAQSYRCTGKDGKRYYGATIPPQCVGLSVEQLSPQGVVIRRIEGQMSPEERAKRDAEARGAAEKEAAAKEEARRNRALLAAYQSEKDIEAARKRALDDNAKGVQEIEVRMTQIKKRQEGLQKEMEFYSAPKSDGKSKVAGKAQAASKPPAKLDEDVKNAEKDYKSQEDELVAKKKEVDTINARFDDDKKRYLELQKAGGVAPAPATAPAAKK